VVSLESARSSYYGEYRFGDVFCDLKRAPNAVRSRLAKVSGVAALETQVVGALRLYLPKGSEIVDGTIISLPEGPARGLNQILLKTGRFPEKGDEVVISEPFAQARLLRSGDFVDVIMQGARKRLRIVGVGISPESVFEKRPGDPLPDSKRFGLFWMKERELAAAYGLEGAFNRIVVDVAPGVDVRSVMGEVDRILAPYGGLTAYERANHSSDKALNGEIKILGALSVAFPLVFLSLSTFMIAGLLARAVYMQREQIAQLKALGYSAVQIGRHYLKFTLAIVAFGLLAGVATGVLLGGNVVDLYRKFFRFPVLPLEIDYGAIAMAMVISVVSTLLGVSSVLYQAMRLPPAEGMRPARPAKFVPSIFEHVRIHRFLTRSTRMALRNLARKPWRAAVTAFGIAMATAVSIVPGALRDAIDYLGELQWTRMQRQDVTVRLTEPGPAAAFRDLRRLAAVVQAEPFRSVRVRIHFGHRSRSLSLMGLSQSGQLVRMFDAKGRALDPPSEGLLISKKLAEILGARVGDRLLVESLEGRRLWREVPLRALIADYHGLNAVMSIESLRQLMLEGEIISGAHLRIDPLGWSAFLESVRTAPRIAVLGIKSAMSESFRRWTGESLRVVQKIYFLFATMLAFGVVYTSSRIAFSERSRDIAILRIVGFSRGEVTRVLLAELAVPMTFALPFGLWIGGKLAGLTLQAASTETARLPVILSTETYLISSLVIVVSAGISFAVVGKGIRNLDLLAFLRTSE
ncbi:MAG TPA: FtsX-like permease family protein, partial [Terrimicrobiaceae bacterium]|nr:FtsX-like permease family protein [Terrimicrobiaceae bacterium]